MAVRDWRGDDTAGSERRLKGWPPPTAGFGRLGHVGPVVKQEEEEESQAALEAVGGGCVRSGDIL